MGIEAAADLGYLSLGSPLPRQNFPLPLAVFESQGPGHRGVG